MLGGLTTLTEIKSAAFQVLADCRHNKIHGAPLRCTNYVYLLVVTLP